MTPPRRPVPEISVVIPAYREAATLPRLLAQLTPALRDRHALEVIVSDGGSDDGTAEAARASADRVLIHPGPGRQTIAAGRNRGADAARGRIIVFLNADVTIADPDALFAGVAAAFRDPRAAAVTCRVSVDPAEETAFDRRFHAGFNAWCRLSTAMGVGMGRGEFQAVPSELFRRVGGYDEKLAAAEDYDLFRRLRRKGAVRFLDGAAVYESPRRYRALGYPRVLWLWFSNAVSVTLFGRARSREWTPVRQVVPWLIFRGFFDMFFL